MPRPASLPNAQDLRAVGLGAVFRARDFKEGGYSAAKLRAMVDAGLVEHLERGLYRCVDADISQYHSWAMVAARAPAGSVFCLLSALSYHAIGTTMPRQIWLGIPRGSRRPAMRQPLQILHFSGASLRYGVEEHFLDGVPALISNPARTIVDCFRFRRLVGMEHSLEALRDALVQRLTTVDEIDRVAEVWRLSSRMAPYLEAALSYDSGG